MKTSIKMGQRFSAGSLRETSGGFTLIELLVVITIIAILASMFAPAIQTMMIKADSTQCQSNLRQLAICVQMYAQDHDSVYPILQGQPNSVVPPGTWGFDANGNPIVPMTILAALGPYGVTQNNLKCPADVKTFNSFATNGTSYYWFPYADAETLNLTQIVGGRRVFRVHTISAVKLRLFADMNPNVHHNKTNMGFADGHTAQF